MGTWLSLTFTWIFVFTEGDLSKLLKLIMIVKPLICALNSALNLHKPLTASRFVIKALREYTDPARPALPHSTPPLDLSQ